MINKALKILFCQPTLDLSGSENSLLEVLAGLSVRMKREQVLVLAGKDGPMKAAYSMYAMVHIVHAPKLSRNPRVWGPFLRSFFSVYSMLRSLDCNMIYVNTLMFPQAYVAGLARRLPVIVHVREVESTYGKAAYFIYYMLARICSGHLVAVCEYVFRQRTAGFLDKVFSNRSRSVIHNSTSDDLGARCRRIKEPVELLAVIPVTRRKGIFDLIALSMKLSELAPSLRFRIHVVGQQRDKKAVEEVRLSLRKHRLEDVLVLHGEQERDCLTQYYAQADVLVHPSHSEAFPRTVIEAFGFSLPCVATNVGGTGEAVVEGYNGYLVPAGRPEMMARRVVDIVSNADTYERLCRNAFTTYQDKFQRVLMVEKIQKVIRGVLDDR